MQITRGLLSQVDTRPPKGDALDFTDWVDIARLVVEFCDEHGRDANPDASKVLPGWAAETLGFVVHRARRPLATKDAPDLESLLTILRLLRRYKANPPPDRTFFVWVAKQLTLHHQTARGSVTLAEIVGELVPQLPPAERGRFARELFAKSPDSSSSIPSPISAREVVAPLRDESAATRQFLKADSKAEAVAGVALVAPLISSSSSMKRPLARSSLALKITSVRMRAGDTKHRLWDRLAPATALEQQSDGVQDSVAHDAGGVEVDTEQVHSVHFEESGPILHAASPEVSISPDSADVEGEPAAKPVKPPQVSTEELLLQLQAALKRVEDLEAKLEAQSTGLRGEVESLQSRVVAVEVKAKAQPKPPQSVSEAALMPQLAAMPQLPAMPQFPDFHDLFPDTRPTPTTPPSRNTLHLRRPFNFEELRRAESQGLQNKRMRVLVPPDPMQPFPRKR